MGLLKSLRPRLRTAAKRLASRVDSRALYRLASFYVNAVDNDHDSNFHTNGEAAFAHARLPGCRLAFDVGAAVGDWAAIARAAEPALELHCFEPSRRYDVLATRMTGPGIVLNRFGVSDAPRELPLYYGTSGGSNSLFPQIGAHEALPPSETVSLVTLDDYCRERGIAHVDFMKMDIEGAELAALQGAAALLRAGAVDCVQFEYGQVFLDAGTSLKQLMEFVRDTNPAYEFHKLYPDHTRRVDGYRHELDNFKTQNWAFLKPPARAA